MWDSMKPDLIGLEWCDSNRKKIVKRESNRIGKTESNLVKNHELDQVRHGSQLETADVNDIDSNSIWYLMDIDISAEFSRRLWHLLSAVTVDVDVL